MNNNFIPLDSISVANPCNADWDAMQGDDRTRFCGTCQKNVYNLSDMSRREAEELLRSKGESLCAQFARRADGTVITDNCPVGLRPLRNGAGFMLRAVTVGATALIAVLSGVVTEGWAAPKNQNQPDQRESKARQKQGSADHQKNGGVQAQTHHRRTCTGRNGCNPDESRCCTAGDTR